MSTPAPVAVVVRSWTQALITVAITIAIKKARTAISAATTAGVGGVCRCIHFRRTLRRAGKRRPSNGCSTDNACPDAVRPVAS